MTKRKNESVEDYTERKREYWIEYQKKHITTKIKYDVIHYQEHREEKLQRVKEYREMGKGKAVDAKYQKSVKGKIAQSKGQTKYIKTEKGKKKVAKANHKRQRNLGFHPISFSLAVPFDWHHVNRTDVVAIPREIHKAVSHICGDGKLEGVIG